MKPRLYFVFRRRGSFLEYMGQLFSLTSTEALQLFEQRTGQSLSGAYAIYCFFTDLEKELIAQSSNHLPFQV